MPHLHITTNANPIGYAGTPGVLKGDALISDLSAAVAKGVGKSQDYVMVSVHHGVRMLFAGSTEPCAMVVLASVGFPEGSMNPLAENLTEIVCQRFGVTKSRVFVRFEDVPASRWGVGGAMLG